MQTEATSTPAQQTKREPERLFLRGKTGYFVKYDTWNGSPLFTKRALEGAVQRHVHLICDHRVTFLSMKEKWTNFKARELSLI